ncbi:hypothetical protein [Pseudopelagicola sp. nBUS_19]|uniref:hypothetical protein n=1 Tax=unclassified Pseudopelagicola TaxID=2649563 RepID=UPI003EBD8CCD
MHIKEIQISNPTYHHSLGELSALVSMSSEARDIQLFCNVPLSPEKQKSHSRFVLIREALRQIRRMPEVRTGRERVSFAPRLLRESP